MTALVDFLKHSANLSIRILRVLDKKESNCAAVVNDIGKELCDVSSVEGRAKRLISLSNKS